MALFEKWTGMIEEKTSSRGRYGEKQPNGFMRNLGTERMIKKDSGILTH
jgi:hypothetical protein